MKMENKKLERMMDVLGESKKALDMGACVAPLKKAAIGYMIVSAALYAGSEVCKWSEGVHLKKAIEILDELNEEEEEE